MAHFPLRAAVLLALVVAGPVRAAPPLPALNVDPAAISVSGLSSGGFMANQLGYAYANTFMGVGVFAGGPYMCAGLNDFPACMYDATVSASQLDAMQRDLAQWSGQENDALSAVARQRVFLWVGGQDTTVGPNPMAAVKAQYLANGVPASQMSVQQLANAAHTFPTDFAASGDNSCSSSASPYISNCGYDGAGAVLRWIYGALQPRNNAPAASNYRQFDQTPYTQGMAGMASTGWVYVPADCAAGARCRLHVALHGCLQSTESIGTDFVHNTGYTRWADTNHLIVLFPQTETDNTPHWTAESGLLPNGNGCWDWIGWYGNNFAQKSGPEMSAIMAMVRQLTSGDAGGGGGGGLPAPTGLKASQPTSSSMTLDWTSVSGAQGYEVYRDGTRVTTAAVTSTHFVDAGLLPATTYHWTVTDLDNQNRESAPSAAVAGTTGGVAATCYTASNFAQVAAGRAWQALGLTYADGSNQAMGPWNVFVVTTLKQTSPGYYVLGNCS